MLTDARENRWDRVQELEVISEHEIRNFFANFNKEQSTEEEEAIILDIIDANSQLENLASSIKEEFVVSVQELLKQSKAIQQYERHKDITFT